ncbi:MAG TPA: 2-phospho-L-lactate transferase CofD family protein, partial [Ardenticatenaceae bacterium]|nr:2-phospho-L-lactate transferase CofD family protein [Ardenticatenaceae bacterium]
MQTRLPGWLRPGPGIKRWLLVFFAGLLLIGVGLRDWLSALAGLLPLNDLGYWLSLAFLPGVLRGLVFVAAGALLAWFGWDQITRYLVRSLAPERQDQSFAAIVSERSRREVGRPVVVMGGGTGLLPIVRALKQTKTSVNVRVILAPTESGRMSTQLRDELGLASDQVIFPTQEDVSLWAVLENGRLLEGVPSISQYNNGVPISRVFFSRNIRRMKVWENVQGDLSANLLQAYAPAVNPAALAAIRSAELIVIAPGRLFTGLVPMLAMAGVTEMIETSRAKVAFVANLMTEPGKAARFTIADYLATIRHATGLEMDYVIVNQGDISRGLLEKYHAEGADAIRLQAGHEDAVSRLTFA